MLYLQFLVGVFVLVLEKDTLYAFGFPCVAVCFLCLTDDSGEVQEAQRGVHERGAPRREGGLWRDRHVGGEGADGTSLLKVWLVRIQSLSFFMLLFMSTHYLISPSLDQQNGIFHLA